MSFMIANYGGRERVNQLPLMWEDSDGNYIDRSCRFVFARRRGLGIFPLARLTNAFWASRSTDLITGERRLNLFAERGEAGLAVRGNSNRLKEGNKMKPSTENEVAGKVHEVKGKVKEKAGQLTNNPALEADGQNEKIGRKVQKKIGQLEKVLGK